MDKNPTRKPIEHVRRRVMRPSAAEESLSEALNGLEQILEHRQRGPREATEPVPEPEAAADGQYTIPLLHDVVVPGADLPEPEPSGREQRQAPASEMEETEAYRRLAERLANEIEVIVQARVEAAVQKAAEDIRDQVRNHLEIMLPEIIEDLKVLGRGRGS